jgi:hypothetical protein
LLVPKGKSVYISIWIKRMSVSVNVEFLAKLLIQEAEAVTATQAAATAANAAVVTATAAATAANAAVVTATAAATAATAAAAAAVAKAKAVEKLLQQQQQQQHQHQQPVQRSSSFDRRRGPAPPGKPCRHGDACTTVHCTFFHESGHRRHGLHKTLHKALHETLPSGGSGGAGVSDGIAPKPLHKPLPKPLPGPLPGPLPEALPSGGSDVSGADGIAPN